MERNFAAGQPFAACVQIVHALRNNTPPILRFITRSIDFSAQNVACAGVTLSWYCAALQQVAAGFARQSRPLALQDAEAGGNAPPASL
jgi:hypothetical protein